MLFFFFLTPPLPFHNGFKNLYNAQCTYFQTVRYDASIAFKSPIYPPFFYYIPIFTWLRCVVYGSIATHPTVASLSSRPHRYPPRPEDAQKNTWVTLRVYKGTDHGLGRFSSQLLPPSTACTQQPSS